MKNGADLAAPIKALRAECSVEGCTRRHKANGYCHVHYMRLRRHGDLLHGDADIGARRVRPDGYIEIKLATGWILEHRHVMAAQLGRPLTSSEHVHHKNQVPADNRPENLEVYGALEHAMLHEHWKAWTKGPVPLTCQRCGSNYEVKPSKATESRYCSNKCRLDAMHDARRAQAAQLREQHN